MRRAIPFGQIISVLYNRVITHMSGLHFSVFISISAYFSVILKAIEFILPLSVVLFLHLLISFSRRNYSCCPTFYKFKPRKCVTLSNTWVANNIVHYNPVSKYLVLYIPHRLNIHAKEGQWAYRLRSVRPEEGLNESDFFFSQSRGERTRN